VGVTTPLLTGTSSSLRPLVPADHAWLYELVCTGDALSTFRFRGRTVPPEQFADHLWADVLAQMVICGPASEPAGLVQCYQPDLRNRNARLALVLHPDARGQRWPYEAVVLFINHVFQSWDFRKLYFEGPEPTLLAAAHVLAPYVEEEARFREGEYFLGRWVDRLVWALDVDTFVREAAGFLADHVPASAGADGARG
jgi:RimJ/RimL family protein N-acetyltransferase